MQENMNNYPPQYEQEDEIDIMEYVAKLWKHRKMIILWCCIGALIGLVVGFSLPATYKAGATLAPETETKTEKKDGGNAPRVASGVILRVVCRLQLEDRRKNKTRYCLRSFLRFFQIRCFLPNSLMKEWFHSIANGLIVKPISVRKMQN